jgi:hypothetical protein
MEDDIAKILGGLTVNQHVPSPCGARGGNSPLAGAMCKPSHGRNVGLSSAAVNDPAGARAAFVEAARVESADAGPIIAQTPRER